MLSEEKRMRERPSARGVEGVGCGDTESALPGTHYLCTVFLTFFTSRIYS